MEERKNYKTRGMIFLLSSIFIVILWIFMSIIFWFLESLVGELSESLLTVKSFLNYLLWIFSFLSIPLLFPFWIYFLDKSSSEISFFELRKEAWNIVWNQKKAGIFLLIWLVISLIFVAYYVLNSFFFSSLEVMSDSFLVAVGKTILSIIFWIWFISFSLAFFQWISVNFSTYWKWISWSRVRKAVVGDMLFSICIFLGFLFFIVPWIILLVRLQFFLYAIVDKWFWPIKALKWSWSITKGHFWEIMVFHLYFCFFNILWFLCLLVWLVRTVPMTMLATAKYYLLLSEQYEKKQELDNLS